jgi:hypothetical protein
MALVFMGGRFLGPGRLGSRAKPRSPAEQTASEGASRGGASSDPTARGDGLDPKPASRVGSSSGAGGTATSTAGRTGAFYSATENRLYFALEGEVIDATSGRAIETFVVEATRIRSLAYGGPSSATVERSKQTDGRFRIEGLGLGEWRVTGRAEGYAPSAQTLELNSVDADPFIVIPLSGGAEVSGQVVDPRAKPVAEAKVGLEACFAPKPPKSCRIVTTGTDGRFVLQGAPAEEVFAVRAEHPRYGEAVRRNLRRAEGETEHVVLELSGVLKVFGKVLKGEQNSPVAGAEVRVRDPELATQTKPDGSYQLFMPATSQPDVRVLRANRDGSTVELTSYPKGRSAEEIRWVEAETNVAELEKNFQLEAEAARLHGRVTNEKDEPIAEVRLELANSRGWKRGRTHETFPVETKTSADGRYSIDNIPSEAGYDVRARIREGEWVHLGYVNIPDEKEVEANFQLGSGAVRGTFVHADTGAPFQMSDRDCHSLGAQRVGTGAFFVALTCREDARFEVEKVPPGRYHIGDRTPWTGSPNAVTPVEVEVAPGQIVEGVKVSVRGEEADTWEVRVTDERERILPGPYLRYKKDRTLYTSNLDVGTDGVATFSLSRAHPIIFIDHPGHESRELDLKGRNSKLVIEVQLPRAQ